MPAAEGGTNLGLEHTRAGVPLPLQLGSNHHHQSSHYDAEYARMEAWLDENQEFAQNYFMRKATRNVVDSWLVAHASPAALAGNDMMMLVSSPTHMNQQQCSSRSGSGATTPVR
jgi:dual 3',5'-cyclic-AMP and -GMP phosphodiesterase 11